MREPDMKKHIIPAVLLILALVLTSCSAGSPAEKKEISMYDLCAAMKNAGANLADMSYASSEDENAEELLSSIADFDYEKVESFFILYATDGSKSADEIVVVSAKDSAYTGEMTALLRNHLEYRTSLYKTYGPEQVPKLEKAKVFSEGSLAVFIAADDAPQIQNAFYTFING